MNVLNSKIGTFVLRSYVSVLDEPKKETALRIVGGGEPVRDPVELPHGYPPEDMDWTVPSGPDGKPDWDNVVLGIHDFPGDEWHHYKEAEKEKSPDKEPDKEPENPPPPPPPDDDPDKKTSDDDKNVKGYTC